MSIHFCKIYKRNQQYVDEKLCLECKLEFLNKNDLIEHFLTNSLVPEFPNKWRCIIWLQIN